MESTPVCCFKLGTNTVEYSGKTGLKLDPQYTILVLKLVSRGVEMKGKRRQKDTCLAFPKRNKPSVLKVSNSRIPHFIKQLWEKQNPTLVTRAENSRIHLKPTSRFHSSGLDCGRLHVVNALISHDQSSQCL